MTASNNKFRFDALDNLSMYSSIAFVLLVLGWAWSARNVAIAVYCLSFGHYYLYFMAYRFGAVSLRVFKRDAIFLKTLSLLMLGYAYFAKPLDFASLTVIGAGFLLNSVAARALGSDRTYYGYEVADLPARYVTRFPYDWIAHPMIVGNIAAFGGTMLNADFRQQWWPLASTHVALNLGLLIMELAVTPRRRALRESRAGHDSATIRPRIAIACCAVVLAVALAALALGAIGAGSHFSSSTARLLFATGLGGGIFAYLCVLYGCYSAPAFLTDGQRQLQTEELK